MKYQNGIMSESPAMYTFHIEIFTTGLVIRGAYDLPIYRRISDALNGEQRRYMILRNATLAPLAHANQVQHVAELLVDRTEMLIVATLDEPEPPKDYYNSVELERTPQPRDTQEMLFFTSHFALRGRLHKRPDFSLMETLERITDDFVPLSDVHIFPLDGNGQPASHAFACLNRAHLTALCAVPNPSLPSPPAPAIAAPPVPPLPHEPAETLET